MRKCDFELQCMEDSQGLIYSNSCLMTAPKREGSPELVREYRHYLHGFDLLAAGR